MLAVGQLAPRRARYRLAEGAAQQLKRIGIWRAIASEAEPHHFGSRQRSRPRRSGQHAGP
ncbi:MAG: hypothetical protein ACSLEM_01580 [Candidatus Malihini olakiniferum]